MLWQEVSLFTFDFLIAISDSANDVNSPNIIEDV